MTPPGGQSVSEAGHEKLRLLLVSLANLIIFSAAMTLGGYAQYMSSSAMWSCWAFCFVGLVVRLPLSISGLATQSADTYLAGFYVIFQLVPLGVLAHQLATHHAVASSLCTGSCLATLNATLILLLVLVGACSSLGFAVHHASKSAITAATPVAVGETGSDIERDDNKGLQALYIKCVAGLITITVGVVVGGSFGPFLTTLTYWSCIGASVNAYVCAEVLWPFVDLSRDAQGDSTSRAFLPFYWLMLLFTVPGGLLLNAYRTSGIISDTVSKAAPGACIQCDGPCIARTKELVLAAGIICLVCAVCGFGFWVVPKETVPTAKVTDSRRSMDHADTKMSLASDP
jgi:hypothetical protein